MTVPKANLVIDSGIKRDMLGFPVKVGQEVAAFIAQLAENPNTVSITPPPVEISRDFFYYRLANGCYVFWELLHVKPAKLSIRSQEGEVIRVVGVGFDFPKTYREFDL